MVTRGNYIDNDPFEDLDDSVAITDLENSMSRVNHLEQSCSVYEFVNADCETPVCEDIFNETWESDDIGDQSK